MTKRPTPPTESQKAAANDFYAKAAQLISDTPEGARHLAMETREQADREARKHAEVSTLKATYKLATKPVTARAPTSDDHHAEMAGELVGTARISRFITGGKAIFTVKSRKTGARFTFHFTRPDDEPGKPRPIWARVLTGPDNTNDYTFAGTFWPAGEGFEYRRSSKVSLTDAAPSLVALRWFMANLGDEERMAQMEVFHEGRCCRCGRRLTVPSSIEAGIGPDCATKD